MKLMLREVEGKTKKRLTKFWNSASLKLLTIN